jgi:uncharacterized protein (TIGR02145 family)
MKMIYKKNIFLAFVILFFSNFLSAQNCNKGTFTDSKTKQTYETVTIGKQTWMTKNMHSQYAHCYDGKTLNCDVYGGLYNYASAIKVCPEGWRLPSKKDWEELVEFVGGDSLAGKMLKASGTIENGKGLWKAYKEFEGTDVFCFGALPGGFNAFQAGSNNLGSYGYYWTSSNVGENKVETIQFYYFQDYIKFKVVGKEDFFSVRCVKN